MWGCSSAGRALPSQGRGREFTSLHLHHHDDQRSDVVRSLFYFLFFVLPSPLPLGTITPRRIRKLHSSVARPAPEETTPPSCGRQRANETPERMSGCLRASRLRQPSSRRRPAAHAQHGRDHPIPSHPPSAHAGSPRGKPFLLPAPSDARLSTDMPRQTAIFPASPRPASVFAEPAALRRSFQIRPVRNISVSLLSPPETNFTLRRKCRKKFFC